MPAAAPDKHIDAAKRRLVHLGGVADRTAATERAILESAEHRIAAVEADLQRLKRRALVDDGAAEAYRRLTFEHGQLDLVIANARAALAA